MTQAMNLANFANSLDTSGQMPPTNLNAPVPISKGGTNASTAAAARTNLDVAQAVYSVPSGGIIMWSGSIGSIPTGWLLCDGSSGTPDLRNRFVMGAGSTYSPSNTGGSATRTLTVSELPSHTHTFSGTTGVGGGSHSHSAPNASTGGSGSNAQIIGGPYNANANTGSTNIDHTHSFSGTTAANGSGNAFDILNPYYALAFIMKS